VALDQRSKYILTIINLQSLFLLSPDFVDRVLYRTLLHLLSYSLTRGMFIIIVVLSLFLFTPFTTPQQASSSSVPQWTNENKKKMCQLNLLCQKSFVETKKQLTTQSLSHYFYSTDCINTTTTTPNLSHTQIFLL